MTDANVRRDAAFANDSWSNRVLLLSLAGIFFLTLYPFRFAHQESARFLFPFSLNGWGKGMSVVDMFLNVLLFIPFGFGLAEKLRGRGRSKVSAFLVAYLSGALVSYLVEFLQIYIPFRDSGWGDVITNSSGAAIGALMFDSAGAVIIAWFAARERSLDSWLSLPKIGVFASLYIGLWCVLAAPLQRQAKLVNWTRDSFLVIGNTASLHPAQPWKGRISELEIWDHAIPAGIAERLTTSASTGGQQPEPVAAYDFSAGAPFQDGRDFLPELNWASPAPTASSGDSLLLDGKSWLISAGPASALVSSIESTGQFALHVVCESAETHETGTRVVSLSSPTGAVNMDVGQYGSALSFWFRNRFSARRARMTWVVPQVFAQNQLRNILISFNGSTASLFVDGHKYGHPYDIGPGLALARYVRRVDAKELDGYRYVFYAIIFFPAGCLVGFAWRKSDVSRIGRATFVAVAFLLSSLALEWVLAHAAGRAISWQTIGLSFLLALIASLWINADQNSSHALRMQRETISAR